MDRWTNRQTNKQTDKCNKFELDVDAGYVGI